MAEKSQRKDHKVIDWLAVEKDYCTGKFTDIQLAEMHNVSRESIVRRRKRDIEQKPGSWQHSREATARATRALLLHDQIKELAQADPKTKAQRQLGQEARSILVSAEIGAEVIRKHRSQIGDMDKLIEALRNELMEQTLRREDLEALFEVLVEAELSGPALAAARQQFKAFMRIHSRVASAGKLADAISKLQLLERKAFDLDEDGGEGDYEDTLSKALS